MATKNLNNFKRVLKNILCWCKKALVWLGEEIFCILVLALVVVFVLNPIIFVPMAFICPRKAACVLYDWDIDYFSKFWEFVYRPLVAILPFYAKRHFMEVNGFHKYSPKMQVKFVTYGYREPEQMRKLVEQMTDKAKDFLWQQSENDQNVRLYIIESDKVLTDKQFRLLIEKGEYDLASAYVCKHTPTNEMLKMMVNAKFGDAFCYCAERYGLSVDVIDYVYEKAKIYQNDFWKGLPMIMQESLQVYADRQMVRNTANHQNEKAWKAFLESGNKPCPQAQEMMDVWQYECYHKAGLKLSPRAVEAFFSRENLAMSGLIFKYEDRENFTDKAKALILANPRLMRWALGY